MKTKPPGNRSCVPTGRCCFFLVKPTAPFVVPMYPYHPRLLAKSNIEKQYFSHRVNDVCNGSPSRMRRVLRISFGITIRPRSSTRRTMPVAFIISSPLKRISRVLLQKKYLQEKGKYVMGRKIRATPRNLARNPSLDFWLNSKFGKRRNTVCISRFSN